jgi:hypothetical protein
MLAGTGWSESHIIGWAYLSEPHTLRLRSTPTAGACLWLPLIDFIHLTGRLCSYIVDYVSVQAYGLLQRSNLRQGRHREGGDNNSMEETKKCPFCGKTITTAEYAVLRERIRKAEDPEILQEFEVVRQEITRSIKENVDAEYAPLRRQLDAYVKKEKNLNERSTELELKAKSIDAEVAKKVSESQAALVMEAEKRVREELRLATKEKDSQIRTLTERISKIDQEIETRVVAGLEDREKTLREDLQKDFDSKSAATLAKLKTYQTKELNFEKAKQELAVKEQGIDLEVQKRLSTERDALLKKVSAQARETYEIEAKEKDRNIQLLKQQVNQLQERLISGSPQARGYIQQEDLASYLRELYPGDDIEEIKRGVHGADILHKVKLRSGAVAGTILWESKRTKDFHDSWIEKLREDQREQKADLAILVSQILPEEISHFSTRGDVVIAHPSMVDALSGLVRQHIVNVARHKMTEEQRQDKIHDLYAYMTGKEFHQRICGIVESAVNLEGLIGTEIRAHERLWAQRKKLHEGLVRQTALMYGEVSGIVGTLPPVPQLELPDGSNALESGSNEQEDEDIPF